MASSRRLRGSEAKDGRFSGVGCDIVEVGRRLRPRLGLWLS
jgi:hypothetical protein